MDGSGRIAARARREKRHNEGGECEEGEGYVPLTIDGTTYYTTREAAAELGIEWATVRDAIRRGVLEKRQLTPRLNVVPEPALAEYRREHLGQGSQARRLDPGRPISKGAAYARAYRERKKAKAGSVAAPEAVQGEGTSTVQTAVGNNEHDACTGDER